MPGITIHYLLVYSYSEQKLIGCQEYTDTKKATQAYAEKEQEYVGHSDPFEIVLVGADSLETVMKTHGHYFGDASDSLFDEFLSGKAIL